MACAMTKRGSQDNIVTYEFICDNMSDLNAIEDKYKTIGTIAIVLAGDSDGLEVYICGSDKEWSNLGAMSTSSDDDTSGSAAEGISAEDLDAKADKDNTVLTSSLSLGRKENTTIGENSTALGYAIESSGLYSFAANRNTIAASGSASAFGQETIASSGCSFVVGRANALDAPLYTTGTAYSKNDTVVYNNKLYYAYNDIASATGTPDSNGNWYSGVKNLFVVGNGNNDSVRSNAFMVDLHGDTHCRGDIYVGCNPDSTGGNKLIAIPEPPTTDGTYTLQVVVSDGTPTYSWI